MKLLLIFSAVILNVTCNTINHGATKQNSVEDYTEEQSSENFSGEHHSGELNSGEHSVHHKVFTVKQGSHQTKNGYSFFYENSDYSFRHEEGHLKEIPCENLHENSVGEEHENVLKYGHQEECPRFAMQVKGDYGFIADDGRLYKVDYVADENGYRPTVAEPVEHPNH